MPDNEPESKLPALARWEIEEDGYRCLACGYFVRADIGYELPPAECENCIDLLTEK